MDQHYSENKPPTVLPVPADVRPDAERWPSMQNEYYTSPAEVFLHKVRPGFVHDFVLALRGNETPTLFCLWGGLFATSCVLQRRQWLDWPPSRLFPNLYLLYIARPGVCKKSTAILYGTRILAKMKTLFTAEDEIEMFNLPVWHGSSTPEFLIELLTPRSITIDGGPFGFDRPFDLGSRLAIIADELSTFFGRQKYNTGGIDRMTSLYDCKEHDTVGTKKDKVRELRNVFVNFYGGTTPDGFRDSIPPEAHGGGLMSRFIIAWQEDPTRSFPIPQRYRWTPTEDEMARRLAWIAEHKVGEYRLDEEATAVYTAWYSDKKAPENIAKISDGDTRADILLIKTAMLLSAQAYEPGNIIRREDIEAAIELIDHASKQKHLVENQMLVQSEWHGSLNLVERVIERARTIHRRQLLTRVSYKMNSLQVNDVLTTLVQSGKIIITLDGTSRSSPGISGRETYVWRTDDETDTAATA